MAVGATTFAVPARASDKARHCLPVLADPCRASTTGLFAADAASMRVSLRPKGAARGASRKILNLRPRQRDQPGNEHRHLALVGAIHIAKLAQEGSFFEPKPDHHVKRHQPGEE